MVSEEKIEILLKQKILTKKKKSLLYKKNI